MPKRGENIHKRKDGRWEARYKKGIDANGKTIYGSLYANTYREVKAKRQLMLQNLTCSYISCGEIHTFRETACLWLKDSQLRLKGSSVYRYENLLNTHILPTFGKQSVDQITATDINAFLTAKMVSGRVDGKGGLSPSYVQSIMLVIKAILDYAADNRMCVSLKSKISKPQSISKNLPVLEKNDQKMLVDMCLAQIDETKVCVLLSLYAGLRIGEICALEWEDIDLDNQVIHVRKTVSRVSGTERNTARSVLVLTQPKTVASFRDIPICSWLVPVLKQLYGKRRSSFVASTRAGFVSPRTFDYRYHKLLRTAGVQTINYHALRHTFATRCIEAGIDVKTLSELLGHTDVAVTLNTYVHSSMERKRNQLELLQQ